VASVITLAGGSDPLLVVEEDPIEVAESVRRTDEAALIQLQAAATQVHDAGPIWVNPARIVTVREHPAAR